jgi:hypothetical protein
VDCSSLLLQSKGKKKATSVERGGLGKVEVQKINLASARNL